MWWEALKTHTTELIGLRPYVHPTAQIASSATLSGAVHVGAGTRICHGAYIQGPVIIGDNCMVGNLSLIRGATHIGEGTRIGFASEVKNAIINKNVSIGPQCFIADSIIEDDVYIGAQVRTSNHRLDRKNVKVLVNGLLVDTGCEKLGALIGERSSLGIQVIILPGRIIESDSLIGPRIIVEKNLPSGAYRLVQQLISS